MIKFWSYKRELNRYKGKLNSQINKSLNSGNMLWVIKYSIAPQKPPII